MTCTVRTVPSRGAARHLEQSNGKVAVGAISTILMMAKNRSRRPSRRQDSHHISREGIDSLPADRTDRTPHDQSLGGGPDATRVTRGSIAHDVDSRPHL